MDHRDQTFENTTVELDGNTYTNCTFKDVVFKFSGGDLKMQDCNIDRFSFQFGGALANGLFALYQLFGTDGMLQILRGFTEPGKGGEMELRLPN